MNQKQPQISSTSWCISSVVTSGKRSVGECLLRSMLGSIWPSCFTLSVCGGGGAGGGGCPWYIMNEQEVSMGVILNRGSFSQEVAVSFPVWSCWSQGGLRPGLGLSGETLIWVSASCSTGVSRCFRLSLTCSFSCDHRILFILACSELAT